MASSNYESSFHKFLKSVSYFIPLSWRKRFMDPVYGKFIFSKFKGAWFDGLGWKYVVPEAVSRNFAKNYRGLKILDAYAGIGGSAVQLALCGNKVTAAEIDNRRFKYLKHNAEIYGAASEMQLWHGDIREILKQKPCTFDLICVDPPWKDLKADFSPYLEFFFSYAPELVFKVSKTIDNKVIAEAGAVEIREICINRTLFHKEAFFFKGQMGRPVKIVKQAIECPEMLYIFP